MVGRDVNHPGQRQVGRQDNASARSKFKGFETICWRDQIQNCTRFPSREIEAIQTARRLFTGASDFRRPCLATPGKPLIITLEDCIGDDRKLLRGRQSRCKLAPQPSQY
jgi:hypothetical protein